MRQSAFDLVLLYGIGLLGVIMRRFDFPTAPVVVGMILGPLAEAQMRNALSISEGRWTIFLERPGSLALLIVVIAVLFLPRILKVLRKELAEGALGVEFQEVAHGRDAAHGRLAVECGVWPMPVVAVQEGLQGGLALRLS